MGHVPRAGDVYVVLKPFSTLAGTAANPRDYVLGGTLTLVGITDDAPFKSKSRISNWLVRCKYYEPPAPEAVWSGIWSMIEAGWLKWEKEGKLT